MSLFACDVMNLSLSPALVVNKKTVRESGVHVYVCACMCVCVHACVCVSCGLALISD